MKEAGKGRSQLFWGAPQPLGSRYCLDHFLFLKGGGVLLYKEMLKQVFKNWPVKLVATL